MSKPLGTTTRRILGAVGILFSLAAALLLASAAFLAWETLGLVRGGVMVRGQVVELVQSSDGRPRGAYRPVVQFVTADGRRAIHRSREGSYPAAYRRGDVVDILYRPEDPGVARIATPFSLWGGPGIAGGIGALFALFGWMFGRAGRGSLARRA